MYCQKCGSKAEEGSAFCSKCGAKLIAGGSSQQAAASMSDPQTQPQTHHVTSDMPAKKKYKRLPVILGAVALVIVVLIVLGSLGNNAQQTHSPANIGEVNLSQTYTNEDDGISFKYPSAWIPVGADEIGNYYTEAESENLLVFLANETKGAPELNSYIEILKFPVSQSDIDHLFISDEEFKATFDDTVSITKTSVIQLDGVSARMIAFTTSDDIIYRSYFYGVGSTLYRVNFIRKGKVSANDELFFDAVIDSYTITASNAPEESETAYSAEFPLALSSDAMNVFAAWAATHPLIGDYHLDLISDDEVDDSGNSIFLFTFEGNGGIFNMSIRKSDGYMECINKFDTISMDEWYNGIFGEDDAGANTGTESTAYGELLYKGQSLMRLLGSTPEELNQIFGAPTGGTPFNGELLYGATQYYLYDGLCVLLDGQGTVFNISVNADSVEVNGTTLNKNRAGIINLLGTPWNEGQLPEDESGEGFGGYYAMEYSVYDGGIITTTTIQLPDADSIADQVSINQYLDEPSEEEYQTYDNSNYINDSFEWVEAPAGNTDSTLGMTHVKGVVRNTSSKTYSYLQITFILYDSSGNQVNTATASINNLKAGGTWKFDAVAFSGNVSRFEFSSIDGF